MKKLLVLSVLLGLMALPMFASDITFGGDATYGFMTDFAGLEAPKTDLTFDVKAAIDDYNSLAFSLNGLEKTFTDLVTDVGLGKNPTAVYLDQAIVTTDVGKWLDLPIGLKVVWGYDDPNWNGYAGISHYDSWSVDLSPAEYWGIDILASYKMLEFEVAFNPTAAGYGLVGVAIKEPIPGLSAEVYYFQQANYELADGGISLDVVYAMEFGGVALKVAPAFTYNLSDVGESYKWYLAAKATYGAIEFSTELTGNETDAFYGVDAAVKAKLMDKFQPYAGVKLDFADSTAVDTFAGADVGVAALMGATTMYVGYLITENGLGELNDYFQSAMPEGGLYIAFDVNY